MEKAKNIIQMEIKFEGDYINGNRYNGKGYNEFNNIIYELKQGRGFLKEFNFDNKLIFEGEYLYGQKNGKGKEYYNDGTLKYEGEYLNGLKNGEGKEYFNGNLIFEGNYLYNNRIHGKVYIDRSLEYKGFFLYNKKFDGKGYDVENYIIYELDHGEGKVREYIQTKLIFEGEYLNGKRNKNGREYNNNGEIMFEGKYLNGQRNGKGKEYNIDGSFEGIYLNG